MIKNYLYISLLLCVVFCNRINAQNDSLLNRPYDYLDEQIDVYANDSLRQWMYLNAYLNKAVKEDNHQKIVNAYKNMALLSDTKKDLFYADKMLTAAKKTGNTDLIGSAYLTKGILYQYRKHYTNALDNYIFAYDNLKDSKDDNLKYESKFYIAHIKLYLGFYDEAIALYKETCSYYSKTNDYNSNGGYLSSLHSLSLCYNRKGDYNQCTATTTLGLAECNRLKNTHMPAFFKHSEGINQYYKKQYNKAIEALNSTLPDMVTNNDFANESSSYFYIGKSYAALGDNDKAMTYFRKVDRIFTDKQYIRPDLRENLEILINHYKDLGDTKIQLHYINKLIKADSILNQNFKYLSGKMHREFDTSTLVYDKKKIEQQLAGKEATTTILYIVVAVLFVLIMVLLYRYYKNQYQYRQKFEELMARHEEKEKQDESDIVPERPESKKPDINPEVVAALLKNLEKFEAQHKFLQKDLTLVNLASAFNTNTNYLSKVVSYYRNKNYITYLNDLRIDYIVTLLKTQPKYRNYTIKALAAESGFSTAQHFSKAFFTRTGIYPSYFINEINKEFEIFTLV